MSIQLSNDETALTQACAASLPALIAARAAASSPRDQDNADGPLRVALTDPVRELCCKLHRDYQQTTMETITAAFLPYYATEARAQAAAAQTDTAVRAASYALWGYGPSPFDTARLALARFTSVRAANAAAAAATADAAALAAPGNAGLAAAAAAADQLAATAQATAHAAAHAIGEN